jgi:hypothetical protein
MFGAIGLFVAWLAFATLTHNPPGYISCKAELMSTLRSPSTYVEISRRSFRAVHAPFHWWVSIEYDAANAYGTPIRGTQICVYADKGGKPDTSSNLAPHALGDDLNATPAP